MKFIDNQIIEIPDFLSEYDNAVLLKHLFSVRELWESRRARVPDYKSGEWWTLGASLYLDLKAEDEWDYYTKKVEYFNKTLNEQFRNFYLMLLKNLYKQTGEVFAIADFLYAPLAYPGFHIFPPHLSLTSFFGRKHQDLQWSTLQKMPNFNLNMDNHFSGTYCLKLPMQGPHLLYGEKLETGYTYQERSMYLHSGQFDHAIAPLKNPVTQFDWRITLQFHGFNLDGVNYIYW